MEAVNNMIGKYVIVRGNRSGIFAGTFAGIERGLTRLTDCRRLWYWDGAASDFQIATDGTKRPDNCQFTVTVAEIILTDVIEIIPATETAEKRIKEIKEWKC